MHGGFGIAQQHLGAFAILGVHGNAHAQRHHQLRAFNLIGRFHRSAQLGGKAFCLQQAGVVGQHHGKVIAADACHDVLRTQRALEALGHLAQQQVTRAVVERVVDGFELIKVKRQHCQA